MHIAALFARSSPYRRSIVWGCLVGFLLLGLGIWRDYGVSYDAGQSRVIGQTSLRYIMEKVNPAFLQDTLHAWAFKEPFSMPLATFADRDYGVGYELPVTLGERLLHLNDWRDIYFYRHLCTFVVSYLGVLALYGLGRRRYGGDWRTGLAAAGLLVLSPRLFGEFFYNDKDIVFMSLCTVATYTAVCFIEKPTWRWAVLHALACALAIDVRIMAVLWPAATLGLLGLRWWRGEYPAALTRSRLLALLVYGGLLPALVVAMWPYLWSNPWGNFQQAFTNMSHFRWEGMTWYRGEFLVGPVPWHYAPTWILSTTPLLQLGLLASGLVVVGRQLWRGRWWGYRAGTREWQDVLFLGLGLAPLLAVIVLKSVVYDGWRQLYFVYPPLVLLALRGLVALGRWLATRSPRLRQVALSVLLLGVASNVGQMLWMHPFESLYFNYLVGAHGYERYERDYWGISYSAGLNWLLAHDDRPAVRVCTDPQMQSPLYSNRDLLLPEQRKRLVMVDKPEEADYFLGSYRWHPGAYNLPNHVYEVRAGNEPVLSIYRLRW